MLVVRHQQHVQNNFNPPSPPLHVAPHDTTHSPVSNIHPAGHLSLTGKYKFIHCLRIMGLDPARGQIYVLHLKHDS